MSPDQAQEIVISAYSGDAAVSRTSIDEYGKFYWTRAIRSVCSMVMVIMVEASSLL